MKAKEREMLQRAAGIIDGVSCYVEEGIASALASALELIDALLDNREDGKSNS